MKWSQVSRPFLCVLILGALEQKLGMAMQNHKISTLCMETEHSMHTWYLRREGKPFQNLCLCPLKPGNYETPPTEQLDWPSHCLKNYIKMLQPPS